MGYGFDQRLQDCQLVPVVGFLEFVFGPKIWEGQLEAQKEFQNAYINFSHWASMNSDIKCEVERLPRCGTGSEQAPSNAAKTNLGSTRLSQYKDHVKSLKKIKRGHWSIAPGYRGLPYITILVDLGAEKSDFEVSLNSSEDMDMCLCIYACGLDAMTYPFLDGRVDLTRFLKDFYKRQSVPPPSSRLSCLLQDLEDQMQCRKRADSRYMK
ncbi:hypothetical protein OG21DRAFT_1485809 [Imleria badia]|nr:hypothetical protein OG21DRAFT_1485809 [Imleria badia]